MPQRYIEVDARRLEALHDGLDLLEAVDRDTIHGMELCIYGLTQDPSILDAAKESIAEENEIQEGDVELSEVAIAIPISADLLHKITGSGMKLTREEFAYMGSGGEGGRSLSFAFAHYKPNVAASSFTQMAIASSTSWLDQFLTQYGNKQPAQITQAVHRNEEATEPGVPTPTAPPSPAAPPSPGLPKQTSLKLADLLDNFLN